MILLLFTKYLEIPAKNDITLSVWEGKIEA